MFLLHTRCLVNLWRCIMVIERWGWGRLLQVELSNSRAAHNLYLRMDWVTFHVWEQDRSSTRIHRLETYSLEECKCVLMPQWRNHGDRWVGRELEVNNSPIPVKASRIDNSSADSLALLHRVPKTPHSNLGPETGCPDWGFSWILQVPPSRCRDKVKK